MRWAYERTESGSKLESKLLLRVDEVADRLGLGRTLVYGMVLEGKIESVKIGRARRVPVAAVEAYVKRLREDAADRT